DLVLSGRRSVLSQCNGAHTQPKSAGQASLRSCGARCGSRLKRPFGCGEIVHAVVLSPRYCDRSSVSAMSNVPSISLCTQDTDGTPCVALWREGRDSPLPFPLGCRDYLTAASAFTSPWP